MYKTAINPMQFLIECIVSSAYNFFSALSSLFVELLFYHTFAKANL